MHAARMRSASRRRNVIAGSAIDLSARRIVSASPARGQSAARQPFAPHHAAALANDYELVGVDAGDRIRGAAGPRHLDSVDPGAGADAEVNAQIVLRAEGAAAAHLVDQPPSTDVGREPRADRAAIR